MWVWRGYLKLQEGVSRPGGEGPTHGASAGDGDGGWWKEQRKRRPQGDRCERKARDGGGAAANGVAGSKWGAQGLAHSKDHINS